MILRPDHYVSPSSTNCIIIIETGHKVHVTRGELQNCYGNKFVYTNFIAVIYDDANITGIGVHHTICRSFILNLKSLLSHYTSP